VHRESAQLELQEFPPLVYQLLLLSTHGKRQAILVREKERASERASEREKREPARARERESECVSERVRVRERERESERARGRGRERELRFFLGLTFPLLHSIPEVLGCGVAQEMILDVFNDLDNKCSEPVSASACCD